MSEQKTKKPGFFAKLFGKKTQEVNEYTSLIGNEDETIQKEKKETKEVKEVKEIKEKSTTLTTDNNNTTATLQDYYKSLLNTKPITEEDIINNITSIPDTLNDIQEYLYKLDYLSKQDNINKDIKEQVSFLKDYIIKEIQILNEECNLSKKNIDFILECNRMEYNAHLYNNKFLLVSKINEIFNFKTILEHTVDIFSKILISGEVSKITMRDGSDFDEIFKTLNNTYPNWIETIKNSNKTIIDAYNKITKDGKITQKYPDSCEMNLTQLEQNTKANTQQHKAKKGKSKKISENNIANFNFELTIDNYSKSYEYSILKPIQEKVNEKIIHFSDRLQKIKQLSYNINELCDKQKQDDNTKIMHNFINHNMDYITKSGELGIKKINNKINFVTKIKDLTEDRKSLQYTKMNLEGTKHDLLLAMEQYLTNIETISNYDVKEDVKITNDNKNIEKQISGAQEILSNFQLTLSKIDNEIQEIENKITTPKKSMVYNFI